VSLNKKVKKTSDSIMEALSEHDLSDSEKREVIKQLQKLMVATVEVTAKTHHQAAVICCGPEADLAHKIKEEADRKTALLVSNLKSLR
jgi:hypothetical protein